MWEVKSINFEQVTNEQMQQEVEQLKRYGYKETKNPIVLLIARLIRRWRA